MGRPMSMALMAWCLCGLGAAGALADEVCDEFPDRAGNWVLRAPFCGPTVSLEDPGDSLHFTVPSAAIGGATYDNWAGVDRAPTVERYDMGAGDWTITTRMSFEFPPGVTYHTGLMFAFGTANEANDVVYFGEYNGPNTLKVERTGAAQTTDIFFDGGPVSLQVQKVGDDYSFRHRATDEDPWIEDATVNMTAPLPIGRVGLISKTWGTGPEVIADFEYFCLDVPDAELPTELIPGPIPTVTSISSLICNEVDESIELSWTGCVQASTDIIVRVNGVIADTLPPDATGTVLDPPFAGGSILNIEVDNQTGAAPLSCTIAGSIFQICDDFEEDDPTADGTWVFRAPVAGPAVSGIDNPGFVRFTAPAMAFDNWVNVDRAPTFERYDMEDGDWAISTRLSWDELIGAPIGNVHVGLMFAFGTADQQNDVVYWGPYTSELTLAVERVGQNIRPTYASIGGPVSLQIRKSGTTFVFSHRAVDEDPWTDDVSLSMTGAMPVGRVGLIIKSWGGGAAVTADFDYFCVEVFDRPPTAVIAATPSTGVAPLDVALSASGSSDAGGGALASFDWTLGDGASDTGENINHTYADGGIYDVGLTVTDADGNSGSTTQRLFISDDPAPLAISRIGSTGLEGILLLDGATPQTSSYDLTAGGVAISGRTDNFHFLHAPIDGDFKVSMKITAADLAVNGLNTRIGPMARIGLAADAINLHFSIDQLNDGYTYQSRSTVAGNTIKESFTATPPRGALPIWLQLERQGATFIASTSTDGAAYTEYLRRDVPALDVPSLEVGVAACSGLNTSNALFEFEELVGFSEPPPPEGVPFIRGDTNTDGAVNISDASYLLNFLFLGGPDPKCAATGDGNADADEADCAESPACAP